MSGYALPSRQLVSQHDSALIERADVPRSTFRNTWTRKTTFDVTKLYPILIEEVLPGDHLKYNLQAYVRMATPLWPIFDNLKVETFFFFVPNRIIWQNWRKFMGEQLSPGDSINYTIPQIVSAAGGFPVNSVYDHAGIPCVGQITAGQTISVNALPFRAMRAIYNEWFRDENLVNVTFPPIGDGPDAVSDYGLWDRAKGHDYFTSLLPWPQKFTAPTVPLGGQAPVVGLGLSTQVGLAASGTVYDSRQGTDSYAFYRPASTVDMLKVKMNAAAGAYPQIFADLSLATGGVAINTLRQAWLTQMLLERDARGGTRYIELVKSHFGVTSPDARMQRPEYIGGGSSPLMVTPVAQTAPTAGATVGTLGAAATATGSHSASYAATEHGFIIGFINIRSELSYQQGLNRMWTKQTRLEYYWPSLAGLGEQAVLRQEIYCTGVDADDTTVFGYGPRYDEYRTRTSEVVGQFRSTTPGTLDGWHLSQKFTTPPVLGATFIADTPPMDRVLAAAGLAVNQQFLADLQFQRVAVRPIPLFGTPVQLGRF